MNSRRYVLHPGTVESRNDGQRHYVSAAQLADLYKVSLRDCIIYPTGDDTDSRFKRQAWRDPVGAVHLRPRYDGVYNLPGRTS